MIIIIIGIIIVVNIIIDLINSSVIHYTNQTGRCRDEIYDGGNGAAQLRQHVQANPYTSLDNCSTQQMSSYPGR